MQEFKISRRKNIFFIFVIFIIMISLIEISSRVYDYVKKDPIQKYKDVSTLNPWPYVVHQFEPNYHSADLNTNSYGFRGKEFNKIPSSDTYRIVVLGGSAVYGLGASNDDTTIPTYLEKMLNDAGITKKKFEVINAGQGWYNSSQELIQLITRILDLKPNLLIVFDGYNDFYHSLVTERIPGLPVIWRQKGMEQAIGAYISQDLSWQDFRRPLAKLAYQSSFFYKIILFSHKLKREKEFGGQNKIFYFVEPNPAVVDIYERNMRLMVAVAQTYKIPIIFSLQPLVIHKKQLTNDEENIVRGFSNSNLLELLRGMYEDAEGRQQRSLPGFGVHYLNLLDIFDNKQERYFRDMVHLNDLGHRLIAEQYKNFILTIFK